MAQGKLKIKAKLPSNVKNKKNKKSGAATKRKSCPIQPKKKAHEEAKKIREIITKTVNKSVEEDIRSAASTSAKQNLSAAQKAVVQHHTKTT